MSAPVAEGRRDRSTVNVTDPVPFGSMVIGSVRGTIHGTSATAIPVRVAVPTLRKFTVPTESDPGTPVISTRAVSGSAMTEPGGRVADSSEVETPRSCAPSPLMSTQPQ